MSRINKHKPFKLVAYFAVLIIAIVLLADKAHSNIELGLIEFYGHYNGRNVYSQIFKEDASVKNTKVNPYVEPQMGWKIGGKSVPSPTKVASEGLTKVIKGDVTAAQKYASWLVDNSINKDGAMFFPFTFDYAPYWSYSLKAPWNSGLTQGLALGLFSLLYKYTGQDEYRHFADMVYRSYKIPLEKGGFTRFEKDGPFFEEYPTETPTRVLNGAAVTMLALHDYATIVNNKEAERMFESSVHRFDELLGEYDIKEPVSGIITSSYSLAPVRPEILGRFVGEGNIFVSKMKLIGIKKDSEKDIASGQIGVPSDDDVMREFYVWPDKKLMNWGDYGIIDDVPGRETNGKKGEYGHAPFKFSMPQAETFDTYAVEVTWMPLKNWNNKPVSVQLYDGVEWWQLGMIIPENEKGLQKQRFSLSSDFYETWNKLTNTSFKIDNKYIDDNQILVSIIGQISGSETCNYFAKRWKQSIDLVPARWLNRYPPAFLHSESLQPVLNILPKTDQSRHVEYPSVIKIRDQYFMYYCAYGDDERWRLFTATSSDGLNWTRQGRLKALPSYLNGNLAFPYVVADRKKGGYLMYFSASERTGKPYNKICWARSSDGLNWKYGGVAVNDSGLKPLVLFKPRGGYEMFFVKSENGKFELIYTTSPDGIHWDNETVILEFLSKQRGMYTVSGMYFEDRLMIFLESTTPCRRHDMLLYVGKDGKDLKPVKENPVIVGRDWENRWDNIRYGYNFVKDGDKYVTYYNGIPKKGDESGGQIGRAEIDVRLLKKYVSEAK
ncbi:MAG: Putative D-glucuronyl C5-epimerase (Heparin/heparansulfate:glucuronic acid C5 epimerase) [Desulfotomaculum sp. 46_80]|nr:MAG: Putative D-glucuronyl C5-epimerase (Heparin/heparansulfate:glucuronic acid C5 epimerase) [Desulfotomaculum sp. 46_80]